MLKKTTRIMSKYFYCLPTSPSSTVFLKFPNGEVTTKHHEIQEVTNCSIFKFPCGTQISAYGCYSRDYAAAIQRNKPIIRNRTIQTMFRGLTYVKWRAWTLCDRFSFSCIIKLHDQTRCTLKVIYYISSTFWRSTERKECVFYGSHRSLT